MEINDICKCLIETSESPTHFMVVRQVKSVLHKLNPWPELNIDRQLDMYAIHFYDNDIELSTKMQFGVDAGIFYEDKLYPLYCLFMVCVGKNIQLEKGKLPIPHVRGSLPVEVVVKAINDEPELPGEMPDEIYQAVKNDKDALTELVRITVRETKKGILKRLGNER